jgi:hypothetical protein
MSDSSNLPARQSLDRAALERVLARAAELQVHDAGTGEATLSEDQILEIGREVGLSPQHIRQALAEERTRLTVAEEPGFAGRVAGPAVATASRTVPGRPAEVLAALSSWMEHEECLQVKRRFPDRSTWEARKGLFGSIQRGLNLGGRGYVLARTTEVAGTVVPVDEGRVLVRLDADLGQHRSGHLAGGGAMAAGGLTAGAGAVIVASVIPEPTTVLYAISGVIATLLSVVGVASGYAIARQHAKFVAEVQLALEQVLDRLERPEPGGGRAQTPGVLGAAEQIIRGTLGELNTRRQWPR